MTATELNSVAIILLAVALILHLVWNRPAANVPDPDPEALWYPPDEDNR